MCFANPHPHPLPRHFVSAPSHPRGDGAERYYVGVALYTIYVALYTIYVALCANGITACATEVMLRINEVTVFENIFYLQKLLLLLKNVRLCGIMNS